jgi:hypothetical protein
MPTKKKAMTPEKASFVKRRGHEDAREFAFALGIGKEFRSEPTAKKDVIDLRGYSYSVKSGEKKWQIFLYGKTRFESNYAFKGMSGIGNLFIKCIECFPEKREEYLKNKAIYKEKLKEPMKELAQKLKDKNLLAAFIDKGMFNSGEVDFFVVKDKEIFHIFWGKDVVDVLSQNFDVENSKAKTKNQFDAQKVIFKVCGKTYGEIEMRNDSDIHYREVKFWLDRNLVFNLLKEKIRLSQRLNEKIIAYGRAIKKLKLP